MTAAKKRNCKHCGEEFPPSVVIDGKRHSLKTRVNCLTCAPFGDRSNINTLKRKKPRKCMECKKRKNPNQFWGTQSMCVACMKAYQRQKRRDIKKKYVEYLGGQCVRCGYNRCLAALDFHHRDPKEKEFTVSQYRRLSFEWVKIELDKCDLLCRNCHAEVHDGQ
jgi:hypothetical protein